MNRTGVIEYLDKEISDVSSEFFISYPYSFCDSVVVRYQGGDGSHDSFWQEWTMFVGKGDVIPDVGLEEFISWVKSEIKYC